MKIYSPSLKRGGGSELCYSSKNEKITLPQEFIFVFIRYFIGAMLLKQSCQKRGFRKKIKRVGWPHREAGCL